VTRLEAADGRLWRRWWRGALIGGGALVGALALLRLLGLLAYPLLLLFAAIVIAEALAPMVTWLSRLVPRTVAVLLVYAVLVAVAAGFAWVVVPRLVNQAAQLVEAAPDLISRAQTLLQGWDPTSSDQILAALQRRLDDFGLSLMTLPVTLVSALIEIGLIFLMSIYWLLATPDLHRFALSLLPVPRRQAARSVLHEVGQTAGGYVRGKALAMLVVGVVSYLGLWVIGVDYPLVLALIAGVSELIPLVGIYVATIPAVALALIDSPTQALLVLIFYVALQQVESHLLLPAIVHQQAGIPPLLAVFALFAGQQLAGLLGALIAIPLAGVLQVLLVRMAAPAVRRWTGAPSPEG
jgi:predicted PurR-regulated permease PerM